MHRAEEEEASGRHGVESDEIVSAQKSGLRGPGRWHLFNHQNLYMSAPGRGMKLSLRFERLTHGWAAISLIEEALHYILGK